MSYQDEVLALLRAAGHKVEKRRRNKNSALAEWHIGAYPLGTDLNGKGDRVDSVFSGLYSAWRARKLTGAPQKDAAMLLDRFAAAVRAEAATKAESERHDARMAKEDALRERLPGARVEVADTVRITFTFPDLTPEQAERLHQAVSEAMR